jgi:hypothetical protein
MPLTITTPAILFPAITLLMLAYTNRFLALSQLIRSLHKEYLVSSSLNTLTQIKHLGLRVRLIQIMQAFGALSILCCSFSIFSISINYSGRIFFYASLVCFIGSVFSSFLEILLSTNALHVLLYDLKKNQGNGKGNVAKIGEKE